VKKGALKWPQLYDPTFWAQNRRLTDVEIGRVCSIPPSTVRRARRAMHIQPIPVTEASRRTWGILEFRKSRSKFPQLYDLSFWELRKDRTNLEIANELGCNASIVKSAREFLGFLSLTPSQAQRRRWRRDLPQHSGFRQHRRPMDPEIRAQTLARASGQCEIPICSSIYRLEAEHIIDVRYYGKPSDADYLENILVLCPPHHDWWSQAKVKYMDDFKSAQLQDESPRRGALRILGRLFPK
jgi:hypothetical protein